MKLFKILDGNKTILFLSILQILQKASVKASLIYVITPTGYKIVLVIDIILLIIAGIHHAKKGYLGTKKGS